MYYTTIKSIEIPFLYNAAYVMELRGYNLRSILIDPSGKCAISYWGCLSIKDIAVVIQNYWLDDILLEDALKMAESSEYHDWFNDDITREHPNGYTTIYTPDDLNYRSLKNIKL